MIEAVNEVNQGVVHVELRYYFSLFCEIPRKTKIFSVSSRYVLPIDLGKCKHELDNPMIQCGNLLVRCGAAIKFRLTVKYFLQLLSDFNSMDVNIGHEQQNIFHKGEGLSDSD